MPRANNDIISKFNTFRGSHKCSCKHGFDESGQTIKQHRYFQSTAGGHSGDRGARAPLHVETAREHAQEPVTIPHPLTEEMIARGRN